MKLRILMDPQAFLMQQYGGVSRYMTELYKRFLLKEHIEVKLPVLYSENIYLREEQLAPRFLSFFHKRKFKGKARLLHYTVHQYSKKKVVAELKRQQFDVFFPTSNDVYFLKHLEQKPFVMTVHDMINELFPGKASRDKLTVKNKLLLMQQAAKIMAVSQNTKNDILKLYPFIDEARIDVIYLAQSLTGAHKTVKDLPPDYILFVGSRVGYKNFDFFIEAIAPILENDKTLSLICAGGGSFSKEEKTRINKIGLSNRVIQRDFTNDELAAYYKAARVFVFPSAYEGFGIPVLEAMYCGCPVVLPYHSSFPEVAGDAGVFFELNNKKDLADKVMLILNNGSLRTEYIQKGKVQEAKFSWENTVNKCIETMESALV